MPTFERNRDIERGNDILCIVFLRGEVVGKKQRYQISQFADAVGSEYGGVQTCLREHESRGKTIFEIRIAHIKLEESRALALLKGVGISLAKSIDFMDQDQGGCNANFEHRVR